MNSTLDWRFLRTFALAVMVPLTAIALLNFLVNPFRFYPVRLCPPLDWPTRDIKIHMIDENPSPEVLILGSSRMMEVGDADVRRVSGKSAFNAAVDSARSEDLYAVFAYALARGWRPRELLIGLDLESFQDRIPPDNRLMNNWALSRFLPRSMRLRSLFSRAQALLTFDQTVASLQSLLRLRAGRAATPTAFEPRDGVLDGRIRDPGPDSSGPDLHGVDYFASVLDGFGALDPDRTMLFEDLLGQAERLHIRVRCVTTPLHKEVIGVLTRKKLFAHVHGAVSRYLAGLSDRFPGFSFDDMTSVASFGGSDAFFHDAVHMRKRNIDLVLRHVFRS
jgi:hypothetical protein